MSSRYRPRRTVDSLIGLGFLALLACPNLVHALSSWAEVPGNGLTPSTPAAAVFAE
jgi:hypothetical protein